MVSIISVHQTTRQIGAVEVLLPSVNEYKIINQYRLTYALCGGLNHVNYLNIIKRDHVSATVRTRLHLASGWSLDHSGA